VDISLALGGGGSKGYAHLGVIRALEGEGYRIKAVAGTSAGGMAGAVYAAGFSPDEIIQRVSGIRQDAMFGFGRGPALLGTKGIQQVISQFLEDKQFSDLRLPCALTAVDLVAMKEVVLQRGRVIDAVMATIAIPGVFPPQEWDDLMLVDGMVLNPVPVALARTLAPGLPVVAVSLTPEPERWQAASPWRDTPANPLLRSISRLRVAQAFDIYLRSMDITLHMLGEIRLQVEKPEIVIRPDVSHIGSLDRVDVSEVAELGDQAVRKALPELKKAVKRRWWFKG
jgi:NTE family protein